MRIVRFLPIGLAGLVTAHGDHGASQKPIVAADANWMTKHMAEEHHMDAWDSGSFFALHDYNSDGIWSDDEIMRTYGLMDESNKDISMDRRDKMILEVLNLIDPHGDQIITRAKFLEFTTSGKTLPDLGAGPGHHGDDEYEYEIHHWEKYHDENTKLEDLTHPEDIEHFKKHEQMEEAQEKLEQMEKQPIIEDNIPLKFRRRA